MGVRYPLPDDLARFVHNANRCRLAAHVQSCKLLHAALLPCWESQAEGSHFPPEGSNLMYRMYKTTRTKRSAMKGNSRNGVIGKARAGYADKAGERRYMRHLWIGCKPDDEDSTLFASNIQSPLSWPRTKRELGRNSVRCPRGGVCMDHDRPELLDLAILRLVELPREEQDRLAIENSCRSLFRGGVGAFRFFRSLYQLEREPVGGKSGNSRDRARGRAGIADVRPYSAACAAAVPPIAFRREVPILRRIPSLSNRGPMSLAPAKLHSQPDPHSALRQVLLGAARRVRPGDRRGIGQ